MHPTYFYRLGRVLAGCVLILGGVWVFPASADQLPPGDSSTQTGGLLRIEGLTKPEVIMFSATNRPGAEPSSEPVQPSWDQLMNGSLDTQYVELKGMTESLQNLKGGWLVVNLRTKNGVLKITLSQAGLKNKSWDQYRNAVIRIRGHLSVDRYPKTQRVMPGQVRMTDPEIFVDQPAPVDMFAVPLKTAAALTHSDPEYGAFHWVKVRGMVLYVRGTVVFMMDGTDGLRFVADRSPDLKPGDLVEVAGYPDVLSAAAPVLRGAVERVIGHGQLPKPRRLSPDELILPSFDSTWVRVEGVLTGVSQTGREMVLEIRAGQRRFWSRLRVGDEPVPAPPIGSRLELTGTYCAQGEYKVIGPDVAALDLLLNSVSDIKVLSTPSWWTPQRLLMLVGVLGLLLAAVALWVTQLHRQVQQRTAELAVQIQERQRVEHQRAIEEERTRIAQDLHDELGSSITEISMLAVRAQSASALEENRSQYLEQMSDKARGMVAVLDEIVWAMNPAHDSLASLVSYFSLYADHFLGLANIAWRLDNPPETPDHAVDSRHRHQLFLAFKEALTNVVRHSGATEVYLGIRLEQDELRLVIADNGRGLPVRDRTLEMDGVTNMRSRIEKLGGRFELASEAGGGTTLSFFVPAK